MKRFLVVTLSVRTSSLFLKDNCQVDLSLVISRIDLEDLLVVLLCLLAVAQLLEDVGEVEEGGGILLFGNGDLQVVHCLLSILFLVVDEDANIEIGLKVLGIRLERLLIVLEALLVAALAEYGQLFYALRDRIESVDVLGVQVEYLKVNLFLLSYKPFTLLN